MSPELRQRIERLLDLGTAGYPTRIGRRLKVLNAAAGLIVISSAIYALSYALSDAAGYRWIIAINLALVAVALSVPLLHRVHEICGGLVIAAAECGALFGLVALLGRDSFWGVERVLLAVGLAALCLSLHLAAWFLFPAGNVPVDPSFLAQLYISSAVTLFTITGATVFYALRLADRAEAETEALLRNILPKDIVERLRLSPEEPIADALAETSILFSDIQGFVPLSRSLGAERTVALLNEMMRRFDALAEEHGVEKIKTIGDAYMAVAGLPRPAADHADRLARMAMDMLRAKNAVAELYGLTIGMRIGISTGPVMAGIIGSRKLPHDVWGDAVNLAARLESSGEPECIHLSAAARRALAHSFDCRPRGEIEIKGVGRQRTWFLVAPRAQEPAANLALDPLTGNTFRRPPQPPRCSIARRVALKSAREMEQDAGCRAGQQGRDHPGLEPEDRDHGR